MNHYGLGETIKNVISYIYTKLFYKNARLLRLPIHIRGKKYFQYGKGFTTGYYCRLEMFDLDNSGNKKLLIGRNCKIGDYVHIAAGEKIIIGDNCLMASKIFITDISHGNYSEYDINCSPDIPPDDRPLYTKPVVIGNNVWIGENVCILPGVTIGNGCIIGANSVVTHNIPDNSIAVGMPAKVIKKYSKKDKMWIKV